MWVYLSICACSFSCVEQPMWMLMTSGSTLWLKAGVPDGRRQCNGSGQQFKGSPQKICQSSYSLSQGPPDCLPEGLRTWHTQFASDILMANMDGFHLQPHGNSVGNMHCAYCLQFAFFSFNRLLLPTYNSYQHLHSSLMTAINEGSQGFSRC